MTTTKAELNTQDFIAEFGQHELVSDFSEEAINAILSQYKRVQSESNDPASIAWEPLFNDALEWDASGVVYELSNEVKEYASEIINMIRNADIGISADTKEKFDSLEYDLSDEELLQFFRSELMKSPDYFNEVAAILARENDFTKLDNGKYLILGAY
ncbi:hypothetical protein [Psychrobacter glacincola]|jgi:uncharacterized protein YqgQ|uniref:hypothetical protein n=1 Tax=Psychrobacter glacincola TaxID=56810 RepID=UPI0039AF857B|tara:strand:- start:310 stop:780 length:471 start_codon:yes stop_codon:yes gene_type:complete